MKNGNERRLFIAATSQNDGKTTCAVGLLAAFRQFTPALGFIKPIGQRYVMVDQQQIDEDSVLVRQACALQCPLKDMSPVAIERDFTRRFLRDPEGMTPQLHDAIAKSFAVAARGNDLVVIEGTGHAGVGSVFDLNNARVARMLKAAVVIVATGGIGRPVDEITLNTSLFQQEQVPVIGVIVNKLHPDKLEQAREYLTIALARKGLRLLGTIPHVPQLTWPTVRQIAAATKAEILNGEAHLDNKVSDIIVGAMTPHNAIRHLSDRMLLIVPGDRDDLIFAAISVNLLRPEVNLAGIVLTGDMRPAQTTMDLIMRTNVPVIAVTRPTYETTSTIDGLTVKTLASDADKINLVTDLIHQHVDVAALWDAIPPQ